MKKILKAKVAGIVSKVENSSLYKKGTKIATAFSVGGIGMSLMAINSSALSFASAVSSALAIEQISDGVKDFIEPSIIIMCAVAGIRLGMRFLRGATR